MKKNLFIRKAVYLAAFLFSSSYMYAGTDYLISQGATWSYLDDGSDQGTAWYAPSFNDAGWASGASELGYGDGGEATVVSYGPDANNKYVTTYFRKSFNVSNLSILKSLLLGIRADDGAVVYINGVEVARKSMPAGAVNYLTFANENVGGHYENVYHHFAIPVSILNAGTNVIAVEIHQDAVTSSDLSFNLDLLVSTEETFIAQGDEWNYLDNGTDQGNAWKEETFNDASWTTNKSILGYSSTASARLENTTVSYGPSSSNKYITTYFRKSITIADTSTFGQLALNLFLDDGAVIYVNGVESNRINLPAGTITYTTTAPTAVGTASWNSYPINKALFKNGVNVIAVEVHQQAVTSSDMNFEMELKAAPVAPLIGGGCTSQEIGCFASLAASCQSPGLLVLPSTHTYQVIAEQGKPYITGSGNMPTNNDFTAYVPINGSSEEGYLSINHENNPGGVSILDMHYNIYTGLWEVDNSQAVSFSDVVKSERNCSGGITPWGTVVTSEEATTGGDANSDGYTDVGWHVEIDPVTRSIVDQDGNGSGDKLWAMGRSSKENICFHSDEITSYFGLDAGSTSYIWKFVADQPQDLSSGTLYVLKQNVYLGNTAYWVQVPNTTQADRNNATSLATGLGATSFNKVEDVEIGPDGKIYFTSSNEGRVYRFSDSPSITDFEIYIDKQTYTFNTGSGTSSALFNNCDNLAFDPIEGNLWVNIDGNCNYLWMARPTHTSISPQMEIFARLPSGAESTGTTFSPDGRFMFVSMQHPTNNSVVSVDAAGYSHTLNKSFTFVIARKEHLGELAAIPYVELGSDISICQGENTILDAGPGHASYLWSTGETTQTISVSTAGTFSVQVTGSNGRTNDDNLSVTIHTLPSAPVANNEVVCEGTTIPSLTATGNNINWYDDVALTNNIATGSSLSIGMTAVGNYVYYSTQSDANGCESPASMVSLTINALPTAPTTNNQTVCEGTTIPSLTATGTSITWFDDAGLTNQVGTGNSFNTGNTTAGAYTYYATQTDGNGCVSPSGMVTLTINTQPAQPVITGTNTYCEGEDIQMLSATGTNLFWYTQPNHSGIVATGNNFTPFISSTTDFYVTSLSAQGCYSNDAMITVTINPLPSAPLSNDEIVCEGQTIPSLNATGTNVEWYSDMSLTQLVNSGSSFNTGETNTGVYTYYLTQTDGNGCTSLSSDVSLTINAVPSQPSVTGNTIYCEGDVLDVLTATGNNVVWYSDASLTTTVQTGNNFTPSISSTATFYVIETMNGCESNVTNVTVTINPLPTVTLSGLNASYFINDAAVTLTGTPSGGTFSGNGVIGNMFDPAMAGVGTHAIVYSYTDLVTGCMNSTLVQTTVNMNTGLVQLADGSSIKVYPNPSSNEMYLSIDASHNSTLEVRLFDMTGKMILIQSEKEISAGANQVYFSKSDLNLADGNYWLNVKLNEVESTIKIVFVK